MRGFINKDKLSDPKAIENGRKAAADFYQKTGKDLESEVIKDGYSRRNEELADESKVVDFQYQLFENLKLQNAEIDKIFKAGIEGEKKFDFSELNKLQNDEKTIYKNIRDAKEKLKETRNVKDAIKIINIRLNYEKDSEEKAKLLSEGIKSIENNRASFDDKTKEGLEKQKNEWEMNLSRQNKDSLPEERDNIVNNLKKIEAGKEQGILKRIWNFVVDLWRKIFPLKTTGVMTQDDALKMALNLLGYFRPGISPAEMEDMRAMLLRQ